MRIRQLPFRDDVGAELPSIAEEVWAYSCTLTLSMCASEFCERISLSTRRSALVEPRGIVLARPASSLVIVSFALTHCTRRTSIRSAKPIHSPFLASIDPTS